jgi:hypothetical protein
LRLRTLSLSSQSGVKTENIIAEFYEDNRIYGTYINKNSNFTIISPLSDVQAFLGHFTHAISERLNANYISIEKFSKSNFNPQRALDFVENKAYFEESKIEAINIFKEDINTILSDTKTFIIFAPKASRGHTFELLNGGKAGDKALLVDGSSFNPIETLAKFADETNKKLSEDEMSLGIHEDSGISGDYHLMHYIQKKLNANVFQINISANLLKEENEIYYKSIYILSETIKENF